MPEADICDPLASLSRCSRYGVRCETSKCVLLNIFQNDGQLNALDPRTDNDTLNLADLDPSYLTCLRL